MDLNIITITGKVVNQENVSVKGSTLKKVEIEVLNNNRVYAEIWDKDFDIENNKIYTFSGKLRQKDNKLILYVDTVENNQGIKKNVVTIEGTIVKIKEIKKDDKIINNLRIAYNYNVQNNDKWEKKTNYFDCVYWKDLPEEAKVGNKIKCTGNLMSRNNDNSIKISINHIMLSRESKKNKEIRENNGINL